MKQHGVTVGKHGSYGSNEEDGFLKRYYQPPGAPPEKTYFAPFGKKDQDTGYWRNSRYASTSLQSARTRSSFADALDHPTGTNEWALKSNYLSILTAAGEKEKSNYAAFPIPFFDLAAWLYRDNELENDLTKLIQKFKDDFCISDPEFAELFAANISQENIDHYFSQTQLRQEELIELIGGIPEGPALGDTSEDELIATIEHHIREESHLELPEGFVEDFYYALKAQRFVVLAGRPGTGKSAFVQAFAKALDARFPDLVHTVEVSVGQDFGESDVIGYEKIAGGLAATELSNQLFLSGKPKDIYVVILDEMNLSHVDYYLSRLLPAIESDVRVDLPGGSTLYALPPDSFFTGTINSYLEEPTRVALSGPVKRRSNVIEMPDVLSTVLEQEDKARFADLIHKLLKQTERRCVKRQQQGLSSMLDAFRIQHLRSAMAKGSGVRSGEFVNLLWDLSNICKRAPQTSLTLGVLQDVVEYVAMASKKLPFDALDSQIAQKVVPQLSGPADVAEELRKYLIDVQPNANASGNIAFNRSLVALDKLLASRDPSGYVYYQY